MEVIYVTVLSVIKERLYHAPPFSTLLLMDQGILRLRNGSVIIVALWKPHLEVRTLVLVWMDMTC